MEIIVWHIWIIVAIILFIAEIFTPSFIAGCVAIGCILSGIFAGLDYEIETQLIAFSVGTLVAFFGVRPFMLKYAHRKSDTIKTNIDALVGKTGRVTITIDNSKDVGRVIVDGDDWKAESVNNEIIKSGERVLVQKVNSTILIVKPLN